MLAPTAGPKTCLIIVNYNQLWQPVLELASKFGLRSTFVEPNGMSENDLRGFILVADAAQVALRTANISPSETGMRSLPRELWVVFRSRAEPGMPC